MRSTLTQMLAEKKTHESSPTSSRTESPPSTSRIYDASAHSFQQQQPLVALAVKQTTDDNAVRHWRHRASIAASSRSGHGTRPLNLARFFPLMENRRGRGNQPSRGPSNGRHFSTTHVDDGLLKLRQHLSLRGYLRTNAIAFATKLARNQHREMRQLILL